MSGVFLLVGLCLGAIGAMVLLPHARSESPLLADPASEAASLNTESQVSEPADTPAPSPSQPPGSSPAPSTQNVQVNPKAIAALNPGGQVSVVVYDRTAKQTTVSIQPDRSYTSASLVKILIALEAVQAGSSTASVQRMLSVSDDNLASTLWGTNGGAAIVTRWASKIGLSGTRPPADPGRWGDTRITAGDIAKIYRYVMEQAGPNTRSIIMTALSNATENGSDGIRQHFGIPDAAGKIPWSIKQGWSCCRGARILHTSGVIGKDDRYIVVALSSQPLSTSYVSGGRRLTSVVQAILPAIPGA